MIVSRQSPVKEGETTRMFFTPSAEGVKNILVVSPSFTGDCLETIIEIGDEYEELFIEKGGQKLDYVPSLNSNDNWVKCIVNIIREQ